MPDGAPVPAAGGDPADERARATDARLIRGVRVRLVIWSGLSTLLVLLVLGASLYAVVARNLEANGDDVLKNRTAEFARRPQVFGPGLGFAFGGGSSGTFALIANDAGQPLGPDGQPVGPGTPALSDQLPLRAGIDAARDTSVDTRTTVVNGVPVRVRTTKADSAIGTVYIQVIQDRSSEVQTLDAMRNVLLLGGLVVVLVAVAFGTFYASRALVPIRESLVQQRGALRRQREFAADASHELRTPLTVIKSSAERLRRSRGPATDDAAEALADIDAEVGHLTSLVDDLLLLARSDSGAIGLTRLPLDLGDVAAESAGGLVSLAAGHGVTLGLDPEPAMVEGDHARLRQLIVILVDNAIRHTPRGGGVRVTVRSDATEAVLEVDDDGPGILPEDMPHVFERFWRAPGAAAGGTGLGLAIAKSIVDLHDGRIVVSNRPGGGGRFVVRLPVAQQPPIGAAERGSRLATDPAGEAH